MLPHQVGYASASWAAQYNVAAIPSLLVFKDGEVAAERTGLARKADLKALLVR